MIARSPFVSLGKSGVSRGSMLTASSANSSFWAASNLPWRQSSVKRVAICCVFMTVLLYSGLTARFLLIGFFLPYIAADCDTAICCCASLKSSEIAPRFGTQAAVDELVLLSCGLGHLLVHLIHQSERQQCNSHHDIAQPIKMSERVIRPLNEEPPRHCRRHPARELLQ